MAVPVHKRRGNSDVYDHRSVALLLVVSEVLEKIVAKAIIGYPYHESSRVCLAIWLSSEAPLC